MILVGCPQTPEARKTNAIIANTNATIPDNFHGLIESRLSKFLRSLGDYQLFGNSGHQSMAVNAAAATCLTGVGEQARQNNYALSFEVGPNYNPLTLLTDLQLAPTKPIDAGMFRFCHGCAICAHQCPSNSISTDKEPTWEIPLTQGKRTTYKTPGPKLFWIDMVGCRDYQSEFDGCAPRDVLGDHGGGRSCFGVCPFGEDRAAMAHEMIRTTAAHTGIFNSFFASMADVFGTGQAALRPDEWWDMQLPAHGSPTHIRATKGQWKM
jgi:reductive dehalogenase